MRAWKIYQRERPISSAGSPARDHAGVNLSTVTSSAPLILRQAVGAIFHTAKIAEP